MFAEFVPIAEILQKLAAAFALVVGGAWVLMNYLRNRTHVPRVQVTLQTDLLTREGRKYVVATVEVKNPGLSRMRLPRDAFEHKHPHLSRLRHFPDAEIPAYGALIEVWPMVDMRDPERPAEITSPLPEESEGFPILFRHTSIEPGVTLSEQHLIRLPDVPYDAFRIRLRVLAHQDEWKATTVVVPEPAMVSPIS